jgi:hypothetical protein
MSRLKFICLAFVSLLVLARITYSATLKDFNFSMSEEKLVCGDECCTYTPPGLGQTEESQTSAAPEDAPSSQSELPGPPEQQGETSSAGTNSSRGGGQVGGGGGAPGNWYGGGSSGAASSAPRCLTLLTINNDESTVALYEAFYKTFNWGTSSWETQSSQAYSRPYYLQDVSGNIHDCLKTQMNTILGECMRIYAPQLLAPDNAQLSDGDVTWAENYLLFYDLMSQSSGSPMTTIADNVFWVGDIDDCLLDRTLATLGPGASSIREHLISSVGLIDTTSQAAPVPAGAVSSAPTERFLTDTDLPVNTVYIDASCNAVAAPSDSSEMVCGNLTINTYLTPLSLVWERIDGKPSFSAANFQLDPKQNNKWYVWKAGSNMPLLVYYESKNWLNSDDKVEVTSVEQLFGQYTFGKNWLDGFSALASLDKDKNGSISGKELNNLYLWFDNNQNGISEKGEIKNLKKAGVTVLYYSKDRDNTVTGDIVGIIGYERKQGNDIIRGSIVDWMSKQAYDNKFDAMVAAKKEEQEVVAMADNPYFGGVWSWVLDNKIIANGMSNIWGTFVISDNGNVVKGVSIIDMPTTSKSYLQTIGIRQFVPFVATRNEEMNEIKFSIKNQDGLVTENTLTLSENGITMYGVSRAEMWKTTAKKQKKIVHYTWKAYRKYHRI